MVSVNLVRMNNMETEVIRPASALTTDFEPATPLNMEGANTLILEFDFTKGNSTGFAIKIETSNNGTDYYVEQELSQNGGITTYRDNERWFPVSVSEVKKKVEIPLTCRWVKIWAKALTSGTGTSLKISASRAHV